MYTSYTSYTYIHVHTRHTRYIQRYKIYIYIYSLSLYMCVFSLWVDRCVFRNALRFAPDDAQSVVCALFIWLLVCIVAFSLHPAMPSGCMARVLLSMLILLVRYRTNPCILLRVQRTLCTSMVCALWQPMVARGFARAKARVLARCARSPSASATIVHGGCDGAAV